MKYHTIEVHELTPKLGAEVAGANLGQLDVRQIQEIKTALQDRGVLVFRDQTLTQAQHKAFGRLWGDLQTHPAKTHLGVPGDPEIFDISISGKTKVANGEAWHTDLSCEPVPPLASALYITQMPASGGGDTLFASMVEAYRTLSDQMKSLIIGLRAFHDGRKDLKAYGYELKPGQTYPSATHPLVIRHPDSGQPVLFVNEPFTSHIEGLPPKESDALLDLLYRHTETNTRFHCRVKWQENTVVLWDNRAVQHHAVWDYFPETRRGERVTVRQSSPPQPYEEALR